MRQKSPPKNLRKALKIPLQLREKKLTLVRARKRYSLIVPKTPSATDGVTGVTNVVVVTEMLNLLFAPRWHVFVKRTIAVSLSALIIKIVPSEKMLPLVLMNNKMLPSKKIMVMNKDRLMVINKDRFPLYALMVKRVRCGMMDVMNANPTGLI
jgi:hypothetical protein